MATTNRESEATHKNRASIYGFLATAFASPSEEHFPLPGQINEYRNNVDQLSIELTKSADELIATTREHKRQTLLVEHTRLFVGPFHIPAPLYGSVYLETGGTLMGQSTVAVLNFYRSSGLNISDDFDDLPDHICVELEFMQFLCTKQATVSSEDDADLTDEYRLKQSSFLEKYLSSWIPSLAKRIEGNTDNSFYLALASNLFAFLEYERDFSFGAVTYSP